MLLNLLTCDTTTALGRLSFRIGGTEVLGAEGAIGWLHEEYNILRVLFRELRAFTRRNLRPVRRCCTWLVGCVLRATPLTPYWCGWQSVSSLRDRLHVLYALLRLCPLARVGMDIINHIWQGLATSQVGQECFFQWLRRAGAGVTRADEDVLVVRAGAGRVCGFRALLTRRVLRGVGGFTR